MLMIYMMKHSQQLPKIFIKDMSKTIVSIKYQKQILEGVLVDFIEKMKMKKGRVVF